MSAHFHSTIAQIWLSYHCNPKLVMPDELIKPDKITCVKGRDNFSPRPLIPPPT